MLDRQVTFNDGIADIYTAENVAEPGNNPVYKLVNLRELRFAYRTVGAVRFYIAKQANIEISKTIIVPRGVPISVHDVVILKTEDGQESEQYDIEQVQPKTDTRPYSVLLSLRRLETVYDFA